MHGTTTGIRSAGRLSGAQVAEAELDAAWRPWVKLLDIALAAADDAGWSRAVPELASGRASDAPLIDGMVLPVDARRVRQLLRQLLREATTLNGPPDAPARTPGAIRNDGRSTGRRLDALGTLQAAIRQDATAMDRAADRTGVEPGLLTAVAGLAAIPLLRACAIRFHDHIPEDWAHGHCPVCGAWPTLMEIRGLERNRRLRCGRCGTDWPIPVLRCPFCGETHHDKLHALLPEGAEQTRRVDVCDTCKGYIKGISTLQAAPIRSLAITDLATIELDLVARERGYERPSRAAVSLTVTVVRASATANAASPA
jgi:FdhE protein